MQQIYNFPYQEWARALYLHERKGIDTSKLTIKINEINLWKQRAGFFTYELYKHRVNEDLLTLDEWKTLASNPQVTPHISYIPKWMKDLEEAINNTYYIELNSDDFLKESIFKKPFFEFAIPFLKYTKYKIIQKIQENSTLNTLLSEDKVLIQSILSPLAEQILKISSKTLIYELNKERLQGHLVGQTREERYRFFIATKFNNSASFSQLLDEYPVLGRLISEKMNFLYNSIFNALNDWILDREKVIKEFSGTFQSIARLDLMGDVHNAGKAVLKFTFTDNTSIIYKPRPLSIDVHFQQLLQWVNKKGISDSFNTLKVVDCKDHGWVEYVEHRPCSTMDEVNNFYKRQGRYLAILYMLNATDFHYENIIACGEHPYLIDLESLFHHSTSKKDKIATATQKAEELLDNSVIGTTLLPVRINNPRFAEANFSGLGNNEGIVVTSVIENSHTDEMCMKKKTLLIKPEVTHLPSYKGMPISYEQFTSYIIEGFTEVYKIFMEEKETLLSEDGPIYKFEKDKIRIILRPTYYYGRILESSKHPKYLKNGIDRVQLFDLLWRATADIPNLYKVVHSECQDLLQEDVPYLYTSVNSRNIRDCREKCIEDFFNETPLERVINKIENICLTDLEQQIEFINASFHSNQLEETNPIDKLETLMSKEQDKEELFKVDKNHLNKSILEEAKRIGEEIADLAIWSDDKNTITWLSMGVTRLGNIEYSVMKLGLYSGILGMALFYAYLYKITNIPKFKDISQASVNTALKDYIHGKQDGQEDHSAYLGYAGAIYVFMHLHSVFKRPDLIEEADKLLNRIEELIDHDSQFDILSGNAGLIPICLDFYEMTGNKKAFYIAKRCGDVLLNHSHNDKGNIYWRSQDMPLDKPPLTGFSHGTAGIAWALTKLYKITNEVKYLEHAMGAIRYENLSFNPKYNNWANYSNTQRLQEDKVYSVSWCNGATGIGLSRMKIAKLIPENVQIQKDLYSALDSVLKNGLIKDSHCLCHGQLGSLEFLYRGAEAIENKDLLEEVYKHLFKLMQQTKDSQWWECGFANKYVTPNLMVGLAGVGYQLMRFYQPNIPSVLTLEPPQYIAKEVSMNDE